MPHALLLDMGIGSALWSVSRRLARNPGEYKRLLMAADQPRRSDLDERGALSQDALIDICRFFLETCLDRIRYMHELSDPTELQRRMELYARDEESAKRLPKRRFAVPREALIAGDFERRRVPLLIDTSERTARRVILAVIQMRLLVSGSHKAPLRLGLPIDVVERWFQETPCYDVMGKASDSTCLLASIANYRCQAKRIASVVATVNDYSRPRRSS